jgi:ABC-2 type transport system ATP-binding protein
MSEAVFVNKAYKQFGGLSGTLLKRMPSFSRGFARHAGSTKTGLSQMEPVVAVNRVSFDVQEGEIFGLVGPKGSGKSTLIQLIAALLLPDAGEIRVFDHDVVRQPAQVQQLINPMSGSASFFKKLSAMENLLYSVRHRHYARAELRLRARSLLTRLGIAPDWINTPLQEAPHTMLPKVALAQAVLHEPRLLMLDEPMSGMDPKTVQAARMLLREQRADHKVTILVTMRNLSEAVEFCDRVALLDHGNVQSIDSPQAIVDSLTWKRRSEESGHLYSGQNVPLKMGEILG